MDVDLGRSTPIYREQYDETATYELNDIVLYTDGNLYWHFSETLTTGVPPTDATVWTLAFSGSDLRQEMADDVAAAQAAREGSETAQRGAETARGATLTAKDDVDAAKELIDSTAEQVAGDKNAADAAAVRAEAARDDAEKLAYLLDGDGTAYTMAWSIRNGYPVLTLNEKERT